MLDYDFTNFPELKNINIFSKLNSLKRQIVENSYFNISSN